MPKDGSLRKSEKLKSDTLQNIHGSLKRQSLPSKKLGSTKPEALSQKAK